MWYDKLASRCVPPFGSRVEKVLANDASDSKKINAIYNTIKEKFETTSKDDLIKNLILMQLKKISNKSSDINEKLEKPDLLKVVLASILALVGISMTAYVIGKSTFIAQPPTGLTAAVSTIGEKLLNYGVGGYVLPFEVISILLLAAMVGAIIIAKRNKPSEHA